MNLYKNPSNTATDSYRVPKDSVQGVSTSHSCTNVLYPRYIQPDNSKLSFAYQTYAQQLDWTSEGQSQTGQQERELRAVRKNPTESLERLSDNALTISLPNIQYLRNCMYRSSAKAMAEKDTVDDELRRFESLVDTSDPEQASLLEEIKAQTIRLKQARGDWNKPNSYRNWNSSRLPEQTKPPIQDENFRAYKLHLQHAQEQKTLLQLEHVPDFSTKTEQEENRIAI